MANDDYGIRDSFERISRTRANYATGDPVREDIGTFAERAARQKRMAAMDITESERHVRAALAVAYEEAATVEQQRDELLACLRRMCGMYGAYSRRLAPLLAEDGGTVWTFERANELALEAIAKAEGR